MIGDNVGVAIFYPEKLASTPVACKTPEGHQLYSQGRMGLAMLSSAVDQDCHIINIYAPSGHSMKEQRDKFFEEVCKELMAHGDCAKALVGDFNDDPIATLLMERLFPL